MQRWKALLLLCPLVAACAPGTDTSSTDAASEWRGTVETEGDVTTVRTESGSVAGGPAELREEASIGLENGPEEYLFGRIRSLALDDERILVADDQAVVVRVYDRDGQHLMDVGERGQGPGEFQEAKGIGLDAEGRLLVQDDRMRRIHVFAADGMFLESWERQAASWFFDGRFTVTPDGRAFVFQTLDIEAEPEDRQTGMVAYGPEGATGEVVEVPRGDPDATPFVRFQSDRMTSVASVPFYPQGSWRMAPDGTLVTGFPDRYRFEVRHPDGQRMVVERATESLPLDPEEFEWVKGTIVARFQSYDPTWTWDGPGAPTTRPFYERLHIGRGGRVWVMRQVGSIEHEGCARDSHDPEERQAAPCYTPERVFDVFEAEGRFLTTVDAPDRIDLLVAPVIDGEDVVLAVSDEMGISRVKRYRLALPGEEER